MSNELSGSWNYPTSIRFGPGCIRQLASACRELGMQRPLLVTDPGLAALPLVSDTVAILGDSDMPCAVFSSIQGRSFITMSAHSCFRTMAEPVQ